MPISKTISVKISRNEVIYLDMKVIYWNCAQFNINYGYKNNI